MIPIILLLITINYFLGCCEANALILKNRNLASTVCNLSGNITCSITATGQSCDSYTIPSSDKCGLVLPVTYTFTYCNLNSDVVVLNSSTVLKSAFYNYAYTSKLPASSCVTQNNDGVINTCNNATSFASMSLKGYIPLASYNIWCYYYKFLRVQPRLSTKAPTKRPTRKQKTKAPTKRPLRAPSAKPILKPSKKPSKKRSSNPSVSPSSRPSLSKTFKPTAKTSSRPSFWKSSKLSSKPSNYLKAAPTLKPMVRPSSRPSAKPLSKPSTKPSAGPTVKPSTKPSIAPSSRPTKSPISKPTTKPSSQPIAKPSTKPTARPSTRPTATPTMVPTKPVIKVSSKKPSSRPSLRRTSAPTIAAAQNVIKPPSPRPSANRPVSRIPTVVPTKERLPTLVPSKKSTRKPSKGKMTSKPTSLICNRLPSTRAQQITQTISSISDSSALANTTSPQARALDWLVNQDGLRLCPEDTQLIQRYTLAVFYFSTNGDAWVACGRRSTVSCIPNLSFVIGDPVVARYSNKTWLSTMDECLWGGLSCNNATGKVDRLEFNSIMSNKLGGTLPMEITQLSTIRFLIINGCCSPSIPIYGGSGYVSVGGRLPENIGVLSSLLVVDVGYNVMSGSIPSSLLSLTKLRSINIGSNKFVGSFPSPAAYGVQFQKLLSLHIEENMFSGIIPNFGTSVKMSNLTMEGNQFAGTVPSAICSLTTASNNFTLKALWADCTVCPTTVSCCTRCF